MNNLAEILVPLGFFAATFGIIFIFISARNRERMAMIENGADPALFRPDPKYKMFNTLRIALLLIGIGVGLGIGLILSEAMGLEEGIIFSTILLFGGGGLLVAYLLRHKVMKEE